MPGHSPSGKVVLAPATPEGLRPLAIGTHESRAHAVGVAEPGEARDLTEGTTASLNLDPSCLDTQLLYCLRGRASRLLKEKAGELSGAHACRFSGAR